MDDKFQDLRLAIMPTAEESRRFRQILVNVVMATDIVDKDLKALRNKRWETAFSNSSIDGIIEMNLRDQINRKATIVIDYLIQASDVSHTMQHWHVYRKWNERFFKECYAAYLDGRAEKNPADSWYQGELGFFDFYIIPLAKKLKECGVFGKCSGEYLDYAMRNRQEWEAKGMEVVANMVAVVSKDTDTVDS
jgi:3'5'-cyclic nucleotide phosphodiesterase